jgi:pimeloyl-ACP methyl ester carboxylesterase
MAGHWIEVNETTLYCEQHGTGTLIVLIHGGLASRARWEPVDHFRLIAPDSRGHGRATNPARELSYPRIADDVAALITLDLAASFHRSLPHAELAICPQTDHAAPTPERARLLAGLIRDFARRHTHAQAVKTP